MSVLAILGSSSSSGSTRQLADAVLSGCEGRLLDLNDYQLTPWDYQAGNDRDDFLKIAEEMAAATDIIFSTPVYWYSMSAQLKVCIDRLSDLISRRKTLGRSLAGKRTWLIATGSAASLPEGFLVPFRRTSQYFSMHYSGTLYGMTSELGLHPSALDNAKKFSALIHQFAKDKE